jgi:hypothetical protein
MTKALLEIYTTQKTSFETQLDGITEDESTAGIKEAVQRLSNIDFF